MNQLNRKDYEYIHNKMFDILKIIHDEFEKNKIFYTLACGTTLGAIREENFIEWDLDADIFIKLEDREKARKILKKIFSNSKEFFYVDCSKDNISSHDDVSFKYNNISFSVDIYPLIGFPDNEKEQIQFIKKCKKTNKLFSCKYGDIKRVRSFLKKIPFLLIRLLQHLIPDSYFRKKIVKLENSYPIDNTEFVSYIALDGRIGEVIDKNILFSRKKTKFNGYEFYIPENDKFYLSSVYGKDYMIPKKY